MVEPMLRIRLMMRLGLLGPLVRLARWSAAADQLPVQRTAVVAERKRVPVTSA
jgi:hypothetical protein